MSLLDQSFNTAVNIVKNLKKRPSDEELLDLYGLYKQSTLGNVNTEKPNIFYFRERKKWEAWEKYLNLSQEKSKMEYVNMVKKLFDKYN